MGDNPFAKLNQLDRSQLPVGKEYEPNKNAAKNNGVKKAEDTKPTNQRNFDNNVGKPPATKTSNKSNFQNTYNKQSGNNQHSNSNRNDNRNHTQTGQAYAPYNFVPLQNQILPSPLETALQNSANKIARQRQYGEFIRQNGKLSGYINLKITTKTPTFIGGQDSDFYKIAGRYAIPGSSIRGMVKNYLKIITLGAMRPKDSEDLFDRKLYFRNMAGIKSSQRQLYISRMTTKAINQKTGQSIDVNKALPGFLVKLNNKYYIYPAKDEWRSYRDIYDMKENINSIDWQAEYVAYHTGQAIGAKPSSGPKAKNGYEGKHKYFWIRPGDWREKYEITEQTIEDYKEDKYRSGVNLLADEKTAAKGHPHPLTRKEAERKGLLDTLLRGAPAFDTIIPCYYVVDERKEIDSFGFGKYYRIPYKSSIGKHVPAALQKPTIDFADALFGKKDLWSSRVFFDDAFLQNNKQPSAPQLAKPLIGAKPTSFQLYLEQSGSGDPKHWDNDGVNIRGYKMYWHKTVQESDWKAGNDEQKNLDILKRISPMPEGAVFQGKLRFSDLTDEELGAILTVFSFEENYYHKIGMGKPFGLGSIKIEAKLCLYDLKKRYSGFCADGAWQADRESDAAEYTQIFTEYALANLKSPTAYTTNLDNLKIMMRWDSIDKSKAKYMSFNEPIGARLYKERIKLPSACELGKK